MSSRVVHEYLACWMCTWLMHVWRRFTEEQSQRSSSMVAWTVFLHHISGLWLFGSSIPYTTSLGTWKAQCCILSSCTVFYALAILFRSRDLLYWTRHTWIIALSDLNSLPPPPPKMKVSHGDLWWTSFMLRFPCPFKETFFHEFIRLIAVQV